MAQAVPRPEKEQCFWPVAIKTNTILKRRGDLHLQLCVSSKLVIFQTYAEPFSFCCALHCRMSCMSKFALLALGFLRTVYLEVRGRGLSSHLFRCLHPLDLVIHQYQNMLIYLIKTYSQLFISTKTRWVCLNIDMIKGQRNLLQIIMVQNILFCLSKLIF